MVQRESRYFLSYEFCGTHERNNEDVLQSISFKFPQLDPFQIDPNLFSSKISRKKESHITPSIVQGFVSSSLAKHFTLLKNNTFFILSMEYKNHLNTYEKFYLYSFKQDKCKFVFEGAANHVLFDYTHNILAEFINLFMSVSSEIPFELLYEKASGKKYIKNRKLEFLTDRDQLLNVLKNFKILSESISETSTNSFVLNNVMDIINDVSNDYVKNLRLLDKHIFDLYKISTITMDFFKIFKEFIDASFIEKIKTGYHLYPVNTNELFINHKFTITKCITFYVIGDFNLDDTKIRLYKDDEECDHELNFTIFGNYIMLDYNEVAPFLGYYIKIEFRNKNESRLIKIMS
jgi:hypothetical protein